MNNMDTRKTVLLTGCSPGGAGEAMAKIFQRNGLRVFATARNISKIESLTSSGIEVVQLDVTDTASLSKAVEHVSKLTNGKLDYLVSNAGGGYSIPLLDTDINAVRSLYELNVFSLITLTQAFTPLLIASKGTIVSIGSIAGVAPQPWQGNYNASKAAVNSLNNQLRLELAPFNVKVISVIAGGFRSKFFDNNTGKSLPDGSLYAPAREEIQAAMRGDSLPDFLMGHERFAEEVVKNTLKRSPKVHLWAGTGGTFMWLLDTFGWATIWDTVFQYLAKMNVTTAKLKGEQTSA